MCIEEENPCTRIIVGRRGSHRDQPDRLINIVIEQLWITTRLLLPLTGRVEPGRSMIEPPPGQIFCNGIGWHHTIYPDGHILWRVLLDISCMRIDDQHL